MENNDTFKMTYSASRQEEIEAIRRKYVPKEESKIEKLRTLDKNVGRKATTVSVIIGVIGTLIMGMGMSLAMSEFGAVFGSFGFYAGVAIGIIGIAVIALAYPIYTAKLKKEREKIAPEIIKLTDELLK